MPNELTILFGWNQPFLSGFALVPCLSIDLQSNSEEKNTEQTILSKLTFMTLTSSYQVMVKCLMAETINLTFATDTISDCIFKWIFSANKEWTLDLATFET